METNKAWQECVNEAISAHHKPFMTESLYQLAAEKYAVRVLQWANFTSEDHSKVMHQRFIEKNNQPQ